MSAAQKADLVDLEMAIHQDREKDRSILASLDGDVEHAVWLPRSQIEIEYTNAAKDRATITLPQWLAENRRLV